MTDRLRDGQGPAPSKRPDPGPDAAGSPNGGIEADGRRRIGRDLRLLYGSVLDQPLPERFTRLIDELTAASKTREGSR